MAWLFTSLSVLLLASPFPLLLVSAADDTLIPGEVVFQNRTLISASGTFALGFFSPGGNSTSRSTNLYLGIWYNKIPVRTVVWVANRVKPLADPAAVLTVTDDQNVAVRDSKGAVLWSSGVTAVPNGTVAVLLDTGNLVLRQDDGSYAWQSFDNPTDTFLLEMMLRSNFRTGAAQRVVAWRSPQDPSPGIFSFGIDPLALTSLQIITWRGAKPYWRSHVWNGKSFSGVQETSAAASGSQYVVKVSQDAQKNFIVFSATAGAAPARYTLDPTGTLKMLVWVEAVGVWMSPWSRPSNFCDRYNRCGPSGVCDSSNGDATTCRCLQGFQPKNQTGWDRGDFAGGCVRKVALQCDKGDRFFKAQRMKLPDRLTQMANRTESQCQAECLYSCQCTAYAYANVSVGPDSSSCLHWLGELMDLENIENGGEDLNVRLVASEMDKKQKAVIIIPVIAVVLSMIILNCLVWRCKKTLRGFWRTYTSTSSRLATKNGKEAGEDVPLQSFEFIVAITNNFSDANKLGEGGFGKVYKGVMSTGEEVAIKRLSRGSSQGQEEFKNEVTLIAKLQHRNLVKLVGSCIHEEERILIYEYVPNGSLSNYLFDSINQVKLDWERRFNIIKGIARGMMYLHQDSRFKIVHRDLKASNILLDDDMNPKISDFGLARIFGGNQSRCITHRVVGTYGYMSPEYAMEGHYSVKSDVYSFGVLLLEIVSGQRNNILYHNGVCLNLPTYAWHMWKEENVMGFLDSSIASTCTSPAEVSRCLHVGLLCVQDHVNERPFMSSIVSILENDTPIQHKPKKPMFMLEAAAQDGGGEIPKPTCPPSVNGMSTTIVEGR